MTTINSKRPSRLSERDLKIIEDIRRYRLMTPAVIKHRHFPTQKLNAVTKVTARLIRGRLLAKYPLYHPRIYLTLGGSAAQQFGVSTERTQPLGPQALPTEFGTMLFATMHTEQQEHKRLTAGELLEICPELSGPLSDFPYCLDSSQSPPVLQLIRVDLGGKPDHVARKCNADIEVRKPVPQLIAWMRSGQFRLVVVTATVDKAALIQAALSQHVWPEGLSIHLAVVPQLLQLTASQNHGT